MNALEFKLHAAVKHGRKDDARAALQTGASVHATTFFGDTALHVAAQSEHGHTCMADLFLRGACIEARNNANKTPLHVAVMHGPAAAVRTLLHAGADVHVSISKLHSLTYFTPLQYIGYRPDDDVHTRDIVRLLVSAGADVNKSFLSRSRHCTPLQHIGYLGDGEVSRGRMRETDTNVICITALVTSLVMNNATAVHALLDAHADLPSDDDCLHLSSVTSTSLMRAVYDAKAWYTSRRCVWITACLSLR